MKSTEIKIAKNVEQELTALVAAGTPTMESTYGWLFISNTLPLACIRLKVPPEDYLRFLQNLPNEESVSANKIVPVEGNAYDIIIHGHVVVHGGIVTIDGEQATVL